MATRESTSRIDIPTWLNDLRQVYDTSPITKGAQALLLLLNLQLEQAATYIGDLSGDGLVEAGIGQWRADFAASVERLRYMANRYSEIQTSGDNAETRLVAVFNFIAQPILRGVYPAPMVSALLPEYRRGIIVRPDGSGTGFGDAVASATLWNQAVIAGDIDNRLSPLGGRTFIEDGIRRMFTRVREQVSTSAPGEDPTLADATAETLDKLAAAPGALLKALGASNLLLYVGLGVGAVVAYKLLSK